MVFWVIICTRIQICLRYYYSDTVLLFEHILIPINNNIQNIFLYRKKTHKYFLHSHHNLFISSECLSNSICEMFISWNVLQRLFKCFSFWPSDDQWYLYLFPFASLHLHRHFKLFRVNFRTTFHLKHTDIFLFSKRDNKLNHSIGQHTSAEGKF